MGEILAMKPRASKSGGKTKTVREDALIKRINRHFEKTMRENGGYIQLVTLRGVCEGPYQLLKFSDRTFEPLVLATAETQGIGLDSVENLARKLGVLAKDEGLEPERAA